MTPAPPKAFRESMALQTPQFQTLASRPRGNMFPLFRPLVCGPSLQQPQKMNVVLRDTAHCRGPAQSLMDTQQAPDPQKRLTAEHLHPHP